MSENQSWTTHEEYLARLSPERRARIEAEGDAIVAQERLRRKIRDAASAIQSNLPAEVAGDAATVDRYLKALRKLVRQAGGELDLILRLPGQPPARVHELVGPEIRLGVRKVEGSVSTPEPEPGTVEAEAS